MNQLINKGLVSAIFSDRGDLLITPADMAEGMISISLNGDGTQRHKAVLNSVISIDFFVDGEATVSLVKTSNVAKAFMEQYLKASYIPGSLTISLDNGQIIKMENITFTISSIDAAGSANMDIIIKGDVRVNKSFL